MSLRKNLTRDAVQALGMLDPVTVAPSEPLAAAIERMRESSSGCAVVTERGRPIGIFTERDVLTKMLAGSLPLDTPIADVMTSDPRVIREGCSVAAVIKTMHEGGFRHMPVVDVSGCLKGVVSVKRVVEYLVDHFPSAVFNLPPDPTQRQTAREGA